MGGSLGVWLFLILAPKPHVPFLLSFFLFLGILKIVCLVGAEAGVIFTSYFIHMYTSSGVGLGTEVMTRRLCCTIELHVEWFHIPISSSYLLHDK